MKNHKQFTSLDSQISIGYQISIAISVSDATTTTLKSGISLNMNHSSGSWSESCAKGCRISIYIEFKPSIVYFSIFSRFFFSLFVLIHEIKVLLIVGLVIYIWTLTFVIIIGYIGINSCSNTNIGIIITLIFLTILLLRT